MNYNEALERLGKRERRKLARNTYLEKRGDVIAIRFHGTDVVTLAPDSATFNTGGFKTPTTRERFNRYMPPGFSVYQKGGLWYWGNGRLFTDGDQIVRGVLKTKATPAQENKEKKLRKAVNAYARLYVASLPLPAPSGGDCWYCCFRVCDGEHKGKSMGDVGNPSDHILSHIKEKYVVPSLALNAIQEAGYGPLIISSVFQPGGERLAKDYLPRAVRKYVFKRLGMAA